LRTIVITGIAEGLGRTLVDLFLAGGDRVLGCDLPGPALERLRQECPDVGAYAADVGDSVALGSMFKAIAATDSPVHALINNVGIAGPRAPVEDVSLADWTSSLTVNVTGAFLAIQHVLPGMKRARAGSIVNVSTGSVHTLPPFRIPYNTSKGALEALTRSLAREVGPFGVRCNAVRPGLMDNARLARVLMRVAEQSGRTLEDVESEQLRFVSTRSKVSMNEVASMIAYLCSDAARNVTGQIIAVDGGVEWES
jgi:NAD(P)-dependent dehydrogenase (short-subunit alcohol dehydrogenase family)